MKKISILFTILSSFLMYSQNPGDIDNTFTTNSFSGFTFQNFIYIRSIVLQPDGKILVGGGFSNFNGVSQKGLIRLNSDGSIDNSFNIGTGFNSNVECIVIQPDGKILAGGDFSTFNGLTNRGLVRLNSNGSLDTSFTTSFNAGVSSIALQSDGKIIAGGGFNAYNLVSQPGLIRLNTNGTKDTSFNIGTTGFSSTTGNSGYPQSVVLQTNGKILISGNFNTFNGVSQNHLIRLNNDGSKDLGFNIGTGFTSGGRIALQSDGKIIFAGNFSSYDDDSILRLIRLNTDGTKDTSFANTLPNNGIYSIAIQTDGKILLGGIFSMFNGLTQNCLIRLNIDGTKDTSFNIGTGFNNVINSIVIQPDEKMILGGDFTTYQNNISYPYLIRLKGNSILSNNEFDNGIISLYPNPANDKFTIDFGNDTNTNYTIKINNMLGQEVYTNIVDKPQFEVTKTWQGQGMYFVKIYNENKNLVGTKKIILQ